MTEAIRAVVVAGHRRDGEVIRAHVDDPDPRVRAAAVGALSRAGLLSAEAAQAALEDADPLVRRRAVEEAIPLAEVSLVALLDDRDPSVVEIACWASGERQPAEPGAVAVLADVATDHPDSLCREAAVAALGAIGDPGGLSAILAACEDKATVRRRAVLALAPFDGPEVQAALERAQRDRDWQVRQAAEDLRT